MAENYFNSILEQKGGQERSYNWFQRKIRQFGIPSQKRLVETGDASFDLQVGNMNFFIYDPKHKETLPYYDRFPLIVPIDESNKYFLGLNFHYVSIPFRIAIIEKLLKFNVESRGTRRILVEWNQIKNIKEIRPTIKKYLKSHVRSPFVKMTDEEYPIALMLPVQDFKKATRNKVYYDSRRIIYGS
tara:strand:- start:119 stop:676 length:558 start_codon:yes stop_codon:yes gene_type:complete